MGLCAASPFDVRGATLPGGVRSFGRAHLVTVKKEQSMPTPYNINIQDHCGTCTLTRGTFCSLPQESRSELDHIKYTSVYPKGSLLFVEGEQPRGVFVLCSGRAKLTMSSSEGKRLITKVAEAGEIIGVSASILGTPYEVTAETVEPSQVNFIRREDFLRFLASHSDACMNAAQQLSSEHHSAQHSMRSLGLSQTTTEKLARLILDWSETGDETPKGVRLKMLLTHEEIGQMIGSTRETVTRLLSDFRRRKFIEIKGSTVFVTNAGALQAAVTI
jgi:CRP/FNR family transcriptional regulator